MSASCSGSRDNIYRKLLDGPEEIFVPCFKLVLSIGCRPFYLYMGWGVVWNSASNFRNDLSCNICYERVLTFSGVQSVQLRVGVTDTLTDTKDMSNLWSFEYRTPRIWTRLSHYRILRLLILGTERMERHSERFNRSDMLRRATYMFHASCCASTLL